MSAIDFRMIRYGNRIISFYVGVFRLTVSSEPRYGFFSECSNRRFDCCGFKSGVSYCSKYTDRSTSSRDDLIRIIVSSIPRYRLAKASKTRILLMLDEIQALADVSSGESIMASIRAVLSNRKSEVCAVFTGSSQDTLSQIMSTVGAPMYQFAQLLDFPFLDDEYLRRLAHHFASVHPKKSIPLDDLQKAFEYIGHKPELIKDIVKEMSAEGMTDVAFALRKFVTSEKQTAGWQGIFDAQPPIEQALLAALAQGMAPMAKDTLVALSQTSGESVTIAKVRVALDRLRTSGILVKLGGSYAIADRLFSDYIARMNVPVVKAPRLQKKRR